MTPHDILFTLTFQDFPFTSWSNTQVALTRIAFPFTSLFPFRLPCRMIDHGPDAAIPEVEIDGEDDQMNHLLSLFSAFP